MKRSPLRALIFSAAWLAAARAGACPLCDSGTGRRVRQGVFGTDFVANLAATLLPFLIFLGIAAWVHLGVPTPGGRRSPGTDPADPPTLLHAEDRT